MTAPTRPDTWLAAIVTDEGQPGAARVYANTPEWHALMDWCRFHHVDPHQVLAGATLVRDEPGRRIRYVGLVLDNQGRKQLDACGSVRSAPMVEQGEAPPLPYPDVITALLRPASARTRETT